MNIIFFLEPTIEFGNPLFRFATLRNSFMPQIKSLQKNGNVVFTVMSSPVASAAIEANLFKDIINPVVIDPVEWSEGENYNARAMRHQLKKYKNGEIERLKNILFSKLPDDLKADLIIVWESPAYFLKDIFPKGKVIYQMPGFFSRPPFANMISFNEGLLSESTSLTNYSITENDLLSFGEIRKKDEAFLNTINPAKDALEKIKLRFDKVVLFPLQIDDYFMIDSVIKDQSSQFDLLVNLLSALPNNYALVVTNYISRDTKSAVLTNNGINYLRGKFSNFIYIEAFDTLPWSSQFIVPEVDGVVTISSSLGYQTAYWQKPLYLLGESHLTEFSTACSLPEFIKQVSISEKINQDRKIISHIKYSQLPVSFIASDQFSSWLKNYVSSGYSNWCASSIGEELNLLRREDNLLEALNIFDRNRHTSTSTHCLELSQQIIKHDIISFDIFDTLLFRPFSSPGDLFTFIEDDIKSISNSPSLNFRKFRKQAERDAFQLAVSNGIFEITIDEIYQKFQELTKLSCEICNLIKEFEINFERKILYPRKTGYNAFLEAKSLNKRIVLISDMYLSSDVLESILRKNGYEGYEKLYVSSEYKEKKHSGKLFDIVISDLGIPAGKILHIGDNLEADVIKAKSRGIKPFHLPKAYEVFQSNSNFITPWKRDENRHGLDWSIILSIIANKTHDNPYLPHRKGTLFGGTAVKLGHYGFGPLLLGYTKWLIEKSIEDNVEHLYFLSRDGKIMKEAYDALSCLYPEAPQSHYLLCSRRAVNIAKVSGIEDIIDLLNVDFANNTKLSHLTKHRFGVDISELPQQIIRKHGFEHDSKLTAKDIPALEGLFYELKEVFLTSAKNERENYLAYIESMKLFHDGKRAIVDIGYAGTMQESLYQLSQRKKVIGGYYLITFRTALKRVHKNKLPIKGYLAEFIDRHDTYHNFCRHVPLYETLFSSVDTTFIRMARDWRNNLHPIFMPKSEIEAKREQTIREVHKGALDFIDEVKNILNSELSRVDIEPNKSLRVLDSYFNSPHPRDAMILSGIVFEDAYGGTQYKTILGDVNNLNVNSVWKAGQKVLLSNNKQVSIPEKEEAPFINKTNLANTNPHSKSVFIHWILMNTLNEKKKKKLLTKPDLFFLDAKNPLVKALGKRYLKNII